MPTYEYECSKCGHVFERFQSISAAPLKTCPQCRGRGRRRIGTGAGVILRGSGFYATDYRSEGYHKAAKAEKESASGTKTEAKSEAKSVSAMKSGGASAAAG